MAQLNRSISYVAVAAAAAVASLDGLAAASRDYRSLSLFLKFFCAAAAKVTFVPFFPCVFRPNDSKNISASFLFLKLKLNRKNIFWSNFSPVFFCRSIFSAVKPKKIGPVSVWFGLMPFGPTPSCQWQVEKKEGNHFLRLWPSLPLPNQRSPPLPTQPREGANNGGIMTGVASAVLNGPISLPPFISMGYQQRRKGFFFPGRGKPKKGKKIAVFFTCAYFVRERSQKKLDTFCLIRYLAGGFGFGSFGRRVCFSDPKRFFIPSLFSLLLSSTAVGL